MSAFQGGGGGEGGRGKAPEVPGGISPGSYFSQTNGRVISWLMVQAAKGVLSKDSHAVKENYGKLQTYFAYLEQCRVYYDEILPEKWHDDKAILIRGLERIFQQEHAAKQGFFEETDKDRAEKLYKWAQDADVLMDLPPEDDEVSYTAAGTTSATHNSGRSGSYSIRKPPANHPIWGRDGIMHGLALTGSKGKTHCFNPDFENLKTATQVFGHNEIRIGTWYPIQLSAVWNGAHGSSQGGIAGSKDTGAYSVIVSGTYKGMDRDEGDVIWYSGSGSMENTDPKRPAPRTSSTEALAANFGSGKPVRVIRKAIEGKYTSTWAPVCGLRYDGLYRVVKIARGTNDNGGMYEIFKLNRLKSFESVLQTPLSALKRIPSKEQQVAFRKMKNYY